MNSHKRRGRARLRLVLRSVCIASVLAACGGGGGSGGIALGGVGGSNGSSGSNGSGGSGGAGGGTGGDSSLRPGVTLLEKVSDTPVDGGLVESVYKVQVINGPDAYSSAIAHVSDAGSGVTVVDGIVRIGSLASGARATPEDTVTLRHAGSLPVNMQLTASIQAYSAPGADSCAALATQVSNLDLFPRDVKVTSAVLVAATAQLPEHCNLLGTIKER